MFPIDSIADAAIANIIAVILVGGVCYMLGILSRSARISAGVGNAERFLERSFPTYISTRMMITGAIENKSIQDDWQVVLVGSLDSKKFLGFKIETLQNGDCVVFQPIAPNANSGFLWTVPPNQIENVELAPRELSALMKYYGLGMSNSI